MDVEKIQEKTILINGKRKSIEQVLDSSFTESEKEFVLLESFCEEQDEDTTMKDTSMTLLDSTLDQVNFLLSAGNKLSTGKRFKAESKMNFKTPPVIKKSSRTPKTPASAAGCNKENVKSTFSTPKTALGIMQKVNCAAMSRLSSRSAKKIMKKDKSFER